jgi:hypothetical protein
MLFYEHHIFSEGKGFKMFLYVSDFEATKSGRFKKRVYSNSRGLEKHFEYVEKLPDLYKVIEIQNNDLIAFDIWTDKPFELQELISLHEEQIDYLFQKKVERLNETHNKLILLKKQIF